MPYIRLTIKVRVGIPESFKVGGYPYKITASSHLKRKMYDQTDESLYQKESIIDCFSCISLVIHFPFKVTPKFQCLFIFKNL